jgi:hypothetical protein
VTFFCLRLLHPSFLSVSLSVYLSVCLCFSSAFAGRRTFSGPCVRSFNPFPRCRKKTAKVRSLFALFLIIHSLAHALTHLLSSLRG